MMFKNIKYERLDNGNEENTSKTIGLTFYKAIVFWVLLFVVIITHLNTFYNVDDGISNFLSISLDNRDFLENEYAQLKMNNSNPKGCSIPKYDPWSKSALKYMQKKDNYELKKCNVTYVNDFVSFEEGILNIHPEKSNEDECLYQCIFPLNDWRFTEGNWTIIEKDTVPDCDVFHVECKSENGTATFNDLYLQINKIDFKPADNVDFLREGYDLPKNIHNYSVYIILLDSLSVGHATRSLRKTRDVLLNTYKGVEMNYLNKVGENSRPNAFGFLLNRQYYQIDDMINGQPAIEGDYAHTPQDSCKSAHDNGTYIGKYFKERGYITMTAEDWEIGVFNYPGCTGFKKPNGHHTSHPHELMLYKSKKYKKMLLQQYRKKCKTSHGYLMKYLMQFIKTYKNVKKFSYIWITQLLHDTMWKIFPYDDEFAEFFKTNEKAFDDSFLFVMGDHGHRMASFSYTPEGRYERNNPYFYVSVPKNLRDNKELRKNLNDNTNKHTSHFDTYATILDILTEAGRTNFTNLKPFDLSTIVNDTIKGKSLFRPIDESTRDCYNMLVPSRYCLCEPKFNPLLSNASINIKNYLQDAFTKEINLKLENDNLKDKCALMFLDPKEPFKVEYTITKTLKLVFKVDAVTSPGKAKYLAYFDEDMRLISPEITRQNVYKDQAEVCEKISEFRKYCYCKSLLRKNEIVKSIN